MPNSSFVSRSSGVAVLLALALSSTLAPASPPTPHGTEGAVVSAERAATDIGLGVLRSGGNAVDAAVAVALTLAVVHPQAGNLGGGGFAVVLSGSDRLTLDFREVAPAAAHRGMYLDGQGRPVPQASLVGPLAAGVPGTPAGLHELHREHGTLAWPAVVQPAHRLATSGFTVSQRLHEDLVDARPRLAEFPESAAAWLPDGAAPPPGTLVRRPRLGATLDAYARLGPAAVSTGPVAAAIIATSERHGGILTLSDLADYRPRWAAALEFESLGWRFAAMDLPSSGGYLLAATLALLEGTGWRQHPRFGAERAHLLAESWRLVFADRLHFGDLVSTRASPRALLAPARLARLAASIDPDRAARSADLGVAEASWPAESRETTHLAVIDANGMAVSLTTTLNDHFGCGLWVPEAGFFLNNEMDDFAIAPGRPNLYGLVQGSANAIAPGRRMLSSMVPTVGWRDPEILAVGGRGGSRIPTAVAQVLLNLLADGDSPQQAVDRPRIHHQWLPDELQSEADALAPETRASLERRGHRVVTTSSVGQVNIARRLADGSFEAAGDSRGPSAGGVVRPSDTIARAREERE